MQSLARYSLEQKLQETIAAHPILKDEPLTSDMMLHIYTLCDNMLAERKVWNPLTKWWIRSLRKALKEMAEDIYQIPNN